VERVPRVGRNRVDVSSTPMQASTRRKDIFLGRLIDPFHDPWIPDDLHSMLDTRPSSRIHLTRARTIFTVRYLRSTRVVRMSHAAHRVDQRKEFVNPT